MSKELEQNLVDMIGKLSTDVSNNVINNNIMITLKKFSDTAVNIDKDLSLLEKNLEEASFLYKQIDENTKLATSEYYDKITSVSVAAQNCYEYAEELHELIKKDIQELGTQFDILNNSLQEFGINTTEYIKGINQIEEDIKKYILTHERILNSIQKEHKVSLDSIREYQAILFKELHDDLLDSLNKKFLIVIAIILAMFFLRF